MLKEIERTIRLLTLRGKNWLSMQFWMHPAMKVGQVFPGSRNYWVARYRAQGNSGAGSYGHFAKFKAKVLNDFVRNYSVTSVIEFGCGDGNQLRAAEYPDYLGLDISPEALKLCVEIFKSDPSKRFKILGDYAGEKAELAISIDVVFHLVEDEVFDDYMFTLFKASTQYVIIYSSNSECIGYSSAPHVRHRRFTEWVAMNAPGWELIRFIPNPYPYKGDSERGSFSDFYIFRKTND